VGSISSAPYTKKKGVKPIDLLGVVRKLHSTEGTSAVHFPAWVLSQALSFSLSRVRIRGFRPCNIIPLALSTYPFVCGGGHNGLVHEDVVVITEVQKLLSGELSVVVGNDRIGYLETENDILDEIHGLSGTDF
jgi:hypothetical protein